MRLSLSMLQAYDPAARTRFCCPLPDCADKPVDSAHRTVRVDMNLGHFKCHRCGAKGTLSEWQTRRERSGKTLASAFSTHAARSPFDAAGEHANSRHALDAELDALYSEVWDIRETHPEVANAALSIWARFNVEES